MTRAPLDLYLDGRHVGQLLDVDGPVAIQYLEERTPPVSSALPWRRELYPASQQATRAVVEGWLPEERVRLATARQLGVDPSDTFALLRELGADCAGAVQIFASDKPAQEPSIKWLTEAELIEVIDSLPRAPLGPSERLALRASLAGAQGKMVAVVDGDRVGIPQGGQPSSHILKPEWRPGPDDAQLHQMVANETFCMRVAKATNVTDVSEVTPKVIGGRPVLFVLRYDRVHNADGSLSRIHQEDMAQASGVVPASKYEEDGGISLSAGIQGLIDAGVVAVTALPRLLGAIMLAAATGNADQHAKNFSVLYTREGSLLAPLYDMTSTLVYGDLSQRSAFTIGGEIYIDAVDDDACVREAVSWGMPEQQARVLADAFIERLHQALRDVGNQARDEGWHRSVVDEISTLIAEWPGRAK